MQTVFAQERGAFALAQPDGQRHGDTEKRQEYRQMAQGGDELVFAALEGRVVHCSTLGGSSLMNASMRRPISG